MSSGIASPAMIAGSWDSIVVGRGSAISASRLGAAEPDPVHEPRPLGRGDPRLVGVEKVTWTPGVRTARGRRSTGSSIRDHGRPSLA